MRRAYRVKLPALDNTKMSYMNEQVVREVREALDGIMVGKGDGLYPRTSRTCCASTPPA